MIIFFHSPVFINERSHLLDVWINMFGILKVMLVNIHFKYEMVVSTETYVIFIWNTEICHYRCTMRLVDSFNQHTN